MSGTPTPNDSPVATPIQPLHNPSQAAQVVVPQAPLGNVANHGPGMGAKALLAKKLAKTHNPAFISPTDNLLTPCTQKLTAAKKKHFTKGAKPVQLFAQRESGESSGEEQGTEHSDKQKEVDDENPF
ncbi:uncharacterized protein LACBIDRAFT_311745 [Laccaria bicolor S238N-H82]|uniref:Predicted protein n=1 Tax=Laccaria bicolor (strain S238N-H82 / ATCC MYA-4686) TaxID=486041 RepID=B0CY67_LACBS|nr:uncharacterized protein LACBIDRAFT_311745 [Laccaria bicolor S238N-H82]EDR12837.1 predicted protein [Laccaria bicolor S238N-H82]|eukprot:XP_001877101.1 predicted protein [Laccaria bicolor S238N-H82]